MQATHSQAAQVPAVVDHGPLARPQQEVQPHHQRQAAQLLPCALQLPVAQEIAGCGACTCTAELAHVVTNHLSCNLLGQQGLLHTLSTDHEAAELII